MRYPEQLMPMVQMKEEMTDIMPVFTIHRPTLVKREK
jgi:hypothetical protein